MAYGICIHFAAVDWIMSLQTAFRSSIFGPLLASGQLLSGLGFVLVMFAWMTPRPAAGRCRVGQSTERPWHSLFSFLIIWAYMVFFEFMLIWIANLPHEVIWYLDRSRGGWQWVAWALFIFHFAVPFFLLLLRDVKRSRLALGDHSRPGVVHASGVPQLAGPASLSDNSTNRTLDGFSYANWLGRHLVRLLPIAVVARPLVPAL